MLTVIKVINNRQWGLFLVLSQVNGLSTGSQHWFIFPADHGSKCAEGDRPDLLPRQGEKSEILLNP